MKIYAIISVLLFLSGFAKIEPKWKTVEQQNYTVYYTPFDESNHLEYVNLFEKGVKSVEHFWEKPFKNHFDIYVHPNRQSIDSVWQKDWKMPNFKSECWMAASGDAAKLNIISPKLWDKETCEHSYSKTIKTQQLVTHELFHVFHGQLNASPDFSNVEGIDWFVEGLATYASGQCDAARISEIKKLIAENKTPDNLDSFWTGKMKYGLSGSMVMYIDTKYGRKKLKALLVFSKKSEILQSLEITESELLHNWTKYMTNFDIQQKAFIK